MFSLIKCRIAAHQRKRGQKPYIAMATLFIDGKAVQDTPIEINAWSRSHATESCSKRIEIKVTGARLNKKKINQLKAAAKSQKPTP